LVAFAVKICCSLKYYLIAVQGSNFGPKFNVLRPDHSLEVAFDVWRIIGSKLPACRARFVVQGQEELEVAGVRGANVVEEGDALHQNQRRVSQLSRQDRKNCRIGHEFGFSQ
jgi:hypothetical protein